MERTHSSSERAAKRDWQLPNTSAPRRCLAGKAISREEFDALSAAHAQGNSAVRAAEAAVESARLDLQFTEVRASIDGRAGRALVTAGNLAQADSTLLTTLVSIDPVHVYFEADEQTFLRDVELAQRGQQPAGVSAVRVGLANETGFRTWATSTSSTNQVDPRTGTIQCAGRRVECRPAFTPGLFARVQMEVGPRVKAMLIDEKGRA
jgi:multidrug efflux system membrane fusion protein